MQIELVQNGTVLRTHHHENHLYAEAPKSGSYVIRLRNDGPSRRLAVLSVDGVNVIDGEDARHDGPGYLLGPWETIEVPGWKRNDKKVANFEFAPDKASYAEKTGRGTRNVGVIGVAVFDEKVKARPIVIEKHVHHHDWPWIPRTPWPWTNPYLPVWNGPHVDVMSEVYCATNSSPAARSSISTRSATNTAPSAPRTKSIDVGTAYGKEADFITHSVAFERATTQPAVVLALHYATRERLKKMGVDLSKKVEKATAPNPFPGSTGTSVPAPPGWRG